METTQPQSDPVLRAGRRSLRLNATVLVRGVRMTVAHIEGDGVVFMAPAPVQAGRHRKGQTFMVRGVTFLSLAVNGHYLTARMATR
jgi:hypothetical protein